MRWPWVSRELAEQIEHRRADLAEEVRGLREAYQILLGRYEDALRSVRPREVALTPATLPAFVPERVRGVIAETVSAQANGDPRLAAYLHRRARELRRLNPQAPDDQIARELARWDSTEDEPKTRGAA